MSESGLNNQACFLPWFIRLPYYVLDEAVTVDQTMSDHLPIHNCYNRVCLIEYSNLVIDKLNVVRWVACIFSVEMYTGTYTMLVPD